MPEIIPEDTTCNTINCTVDDTFDILPESPYLDSTTTITDTTTSTTSTPPITSITNSIQELKTLYQDRERLLLVMIEMYRFIFRVEPKHIWEKTEKDITDDVISAKMNLELDRMVKESYAEILNVELRNKLLSKKLSLIPVFLDYCYVYYISGLNRNAPFYRLPTTILKFRIIIRSLKNRIVVVDNVFERILSDELMKDIRVENPPYCLRTDLSKEEITGNLHSTVKAYCKELLEQLLKMKTNHTNETSADTPTDACADTTHQSNILAALDIFGLGLDAGNITDTSNTTDASNITIVPTLPTRDDNLE